MEKIGLEYQFTTKPYRYSVSPEMTGWTFVSLPREIAIEIRDNFKRLEEGWGRMKVIARIGNSEWQTAIWFDTKQDTYLLPLKALIRKKENIIYEEDIRVTILI